MKVVVDLGVCVGHGRCYELAPEVFDEDERGYCVLRVATPAPEIEAKARRAAANCPENAIAVEG